MPRRSRPSGRPSTTSPRTSKPESTLRELIDGLPAERAAAVFTHSSWAADRTASYERLEFLGDSVLELAIARTLYDRFPDFTEGRMAKMRSHVVSRASCAVVSRELELGERLAGDGPRRTPTGSPRNRNVLAALLEAALAALYLEHGFEAIEPAIVAGVRAADRVRADHLRRPQDRAPGAARAPGAVGDATRLLKVEGPAARPLVHRRGDHRRPRCSAPGRAGRRRTPSRRPRERSSRLGRS